MSVGVSVVPNTVDKNGVEITIGCKLKSYSLYECHSDAAAYFDVESENNFQVDEVFIEEKIGVVRFERSAFRVDGIVISDLGWDIPDSIINCYLCGNLGESLRDFISAAQDDFGKGISRKVKQIEVVL